MMDDEESYLFYYSQTAQTSHLCVNSNEVFYFLCAFFVFIKTFYNIHSAFSVEMNKQVDCNHCWAM